MDAQGGRDPPLAQCRRKTIIVEKRCSEPLTVSTQLDTPIGALQCSMPPEGYFYAHIVQGGGEAATCVIP